jgi:hypothetical protein
LRRAAPTETRKLFSLDSGQPAHGRRNPARCQPTTVSGFTTIRTSVHRDQTRRNVVENNRSHGFKRERGRFRLRTATCLPQRQHFQGSVVPTAEENSNRRKKSKDELEQNTNLRL